MKRIPILLVLLLIPIATALTITNPTSDITTDALPETVTLSWTGSSTEYHILLTNGTTILDANTTETSTTTDLNEGTYTLTITGTNESDETTFTITYEETPTTLTLSADPGPHEIGDTIQLTATTNQPTTATLTIERNGAEEDTYTLNLNTELTMIYIPENPGDYEAILEADGSTATATWEVEETVPLTVDFTFTETIVNEQSIFTAVVSGGKPPYDYQWLFSDDTASTGEESIHYFFETGTHEATLVVTDDEGTQASKTKNFEVDKTTYKVEITVLDERTQEAIDQIKVTVTGGNLTEGIIEETDDTGLVTFQLLPETYTFTLTQLDETYLEETETITGKKNLIYEIDYLE